jgi:hypothetical protein
MEASSDEIYHSLEQRHLNLLKEHQSLTIDNQTLQSKKRLCAFEYTNEAW